MIGTYPRDPAARDAWILAQRGGVPRDSLDPRRASGWLKEFEVDIEGNPQPGLTVFITNRECPWKCLMCDLWRHTLTERVEVGDVPAQISTALMEAGAPPLHANWIKLFNAGSFFDAGAIPTADHGTIAKQVSGFARLIVENHPALTDRRILPFRDALGVTRLELALGLETAHPEILERLNKRIDLASFQRASRFLATYEIDLRVFVLVKPPFLDELAALKWACHSIDFAFDCGAKVVSLIPTRLGNGALEALAAQGEFSPPCVATVEAALNYGLSLKRGRVFVDLWNLDRSVSDPAALPECLPRWEAMNRTQLAT